MCERDLEAERPAHASTRERTTRTTRGCRCAGPATARQLGVNRRGAELARNGLWPQVDRAARRSARRAHGQRAGPPRAPRAPGLFAPPHGRHSTAATQDRRGHRAACQGGRYSKGDLPRGPGGARRGVHAREREGAFTTIDEAHAALLRARVDLDACRARPRHAPWSRTRRWRRPQCHAPITSSRSRFDFHPGCRRDDRRLLSSERGLRRARHVDHLVDGPDACAWQHEHHQHHAHARFFISDRPLRQRRRLPERVLVRRGSVHDLLRVGRDLRERRDVYGRRVRGRKWQQLRHERVDRALSVADAQCGSNRVCDSGQCRSMCQAGSSACAIGEACTAGLCKDAVAAQSQCTYDSDCGMSARCINAYCHPHCTQGSDCSAPNVCTRGYCGDDPRPQG